MANVLLPLLLLLSLLGSPVIFGRCSAACCRTNIRRAPPTARAAHTASLVE